jgi:plasmid rolling circle replication initiator protein Rep
MGDFTAAEIWTGILAAASAIVLLSNAIEKIIKAVHAAKAPNVKQDERLAELEEWRKKVDQSLAKDLDRFEALDEGERVTQRTLLALLDHAIDGNNIEQMQRAKEALQNHLINR